MSNEMIVSSSNIDSGGSFYFNTDFLPKNDKIYRIHISKKNAPPASLIIGGKDENYILLIAKQGEKIYLLNNKDEGVFKNSTITGYSPNKSLEIIREKLNYLDSLSSNDTYIKGEFFSKAIGEELRFMADTTSNSLVALYALSKSNFEKDYENNRQYYLDFLEKWKDEDSNYMHSKKNSQ